MGYASEAGSSTTVMPLSALRSARASSGAIGSRVRTQTASECAFMTGTRTHVTLMRNSGNSRILRDSLTSLSSSSV
jgi:hypothetical protein